MRNPPTDGGPAVRRQVSPHLATVGLGAVLVLLTVFSVAAAVTNARGAEEATHSAEVSQWSGEADQRLVELEDLADQVTRV
jgi:hypothetical protein